MAGAAAALAVWLGVSLVVLAEGRRGLALGSAVAGAGFAALALTAAGPVAATVIALGAAVGTVRRASAGPPGWRIMPPGSTPWLVLCVAGALVALWLALAVTTGGGGTLRFAVMTSIALAGARILASAQGAVLQTALAALAMGVALGSGLAAGGVEVWPFAAAASVAAAAPWMQLRTPRAA